VFQEIYKGTRITEFAFIPGFSEKHPSKLFAGQTRGEACVATGNGYWEDPLADIARQGPS
jgi:hypothetical protein